MPSSIILNVGRYHRAYGWLRLPLFGTGTITPTTSVLLRSSGSFLGAVILLAIRIQGAAVAFANHGGSPPCCPTPAGFFPLRSLITSFKSSDTVADTAAATLTT
jgi:hypothetical protein